MNITIELIDEMRKRTNCSYQEAKELLEKHNGDIIEAIIEFEKTQPNHSQHCSYNKNSSFRATVKRLLHKGNITRFIIEKNEETYLNIPVNILVLVALITMPIFWFYIFLGAALYLMGYKIRIKKGGGQAVDINKMMDDLGSKVKNAAEKMTGENAAQTENKNSSAKKDPDNGQNKIIIE